MDYFVSEWNGGIYEYKPFDQVEPFQQYQANEHRCEYCGKPDYHADCHAHKDWCPYYCGNEPIGNASLGDGLGILLTLAFAYFSYKLLTKKVNKL